ncbi:glycosyltransferase, partial [bacterium]|nr:glycosyltransferase [bacterium]
DPSYRGHEEDKTDYLIDSINPWTWFKAVKAIKTFQPDLVIIPWWTVFWAPCFGLISWLLTRQKIKVVYFCHNVVEHETASWKKWLTRQVLKNAYSYVVHTREDKHNLQLLFPTANISVHPHPIYDHFPQPKGTLPRRKSLELLFYGFVRPYKGLDDLVDAMVLLKGRDIQLTIAGEFWNGEQEMRLKIEAAGLGDQIELRPRYHTDEETAELFDRADVVVLPYRSATGSGVVPIAYHYNKPVIVTNVGGLPDVVLDQQTGWIVSSSEKQELYNILSTLSQQTCQATSGKIEEYKSHLSWDSLAETIRSGAA